MEHVIDAKRIGEQAHAGTRELLHQCRDVLVVDRRGLIEEAAGILADLKSDPLYTRLCRAQECFRARLSPKPWRLNNMETPPAQYPWRDARAEMLYRNWEQRYEAAIQQYATCRLIKQFGTGEVHPDVEPVLALHDRVSRVDAGLKLA